MALSLYKCTMAVHAKQTRTGASTCKGRPHCLKRMQKMVRSTHVSRAAVQAYIIISRCIRVLEITQHPMCI